MGVVETLIERNADFAKTRFDPRLIMKPALATIVICCVDTRVDPTYLFGAEQGEIMAIRNVGGRVTPLIVLQHTQCGIIRIQGRRPDLLPPYFQVAEAEMPGVSVADPRAGVSRDVALLRADPRVAGARVSGLVYDVTTGLVETVVQP